MLSFEGLYQYAQGIEWNRERDKAITGSRWERKHGMIPFDVGW